MVSGKMGALFAEDVYEAIESIVAICTRLQVWTSGRSRRSGERYGDGVGSLRLREGHLSEKRSLDAHIRQRSSFFLCSFLRAAVFRRGPKRWRYRVLWIEVEAPGVEALDEALD